MKKLTSDKLKELVKQVIKEEKERVLKIKSLDEVPFAGDPSSNNVRVELPEDFIKQTPQSIHQEKVSKAITSFQRWFRSLDTQIRYSFEKALKKRICKELTLTELNDVMSNLQASLKGWNAPEDKNRKPK